MMTVEGMARRLREQDLAAVAGLADPRRTMDVEAEVALRTHRGLACVYAHPNAEIDALGPLMRPKGPLPGQRGVGRAVGVGEHHEELVPATVDLAPAGGVNGVAEQSAMLVEDA